MHAVDTTRISVITNDDGWVARCEWCQQTVSIRDFGQVPRWAWNALVTECRAHNDVAHGVYEHASGFHYHRVYNERQHWLAIEHGAVD